MKNHLLKFRVLILLLFVVMESPAQEWANAWAGPYLKQSGRDITALPNGNFMAAGRAIEGTYDALGFFTPNEADIFLVEITPQGDTVRSILVRNGEPGALELLSALTPTGDNGFILAGQLEDETGGEGLLVIRIDDAGNKIWETTFDFEAREDFREAIRASGGGFVLLGNYRGSTGNSTGFAMKIDEDGNLLWQLPLEWPSGRALSVQAAQELPNGDLLIGGSAAFSGGAAEGGYLMKTDKDGELIWAREYEGVSFVDAIAATPGGSIYLGVFSDFNFITSEYQVMKTDAEGNALWLNNYPSGNFDLNIFLKRVAPDMVAFVGNSLAYSDEFEVEDAFTYFGVVDTMGNLLSSAAYAPAESSETLFNIAQATDGCLAAVGTSTDTVAGSEPRLFCTVLQCFEPLAALNTRPSATTTKLSISPNPTVNRCIVALPESVRLTKGRLSIFDDSGRMIHSITAGQGQVEISTAGWAPGLYHVLWRTGRKAFSGRVLKW
ncbi:MAG: T9SS type A sorting domain-containing protein [Phaeodactylibacter sp.]|nr:T9SS type A sorting domain-containing protein [Phaeodactylibacter sp.]